MPPDQSLSEFYFSFPSFRHGFDSRRPLQILKKLRSVFQHRIRPQPRHRPQSQVRSQDNHELFFGRSRGHQLSECTLATSTGFLRLGKYSWQHPSVCNAMPVDGSGQVYTSARRNRAVSSSRKRKLRRRVARWRENIKADFFGAWPARSCR